MHSSFILQTSAMRTAVLLFVAVYSELIWLSQSQNCSQEWPELQHAKIGSKTCMDDIGCFEVTKDFFHILYRPVNLLPQDRVTIDTQFHLYTKMEPMEYTAIKFNDRSSMEELDVRHRTVFLVHGFIDSKYYGKWMEELKTNILLHSDFNVIIVDWSKGNGAPYTKASANSRVVGAEIALLIQSLQKNVGLDPMRVHIIGHSLGAHIAGYAGERLQKLGRISALDPAAPYFQNMPPIVRLDPTDADFVDVIHTDSSSITLLALGMSQSVGHVDFFPNNGMTQPGCKLAAIHSIFIEGLVEASRRFISCNHQRAVDFFLYSINYRRALPVGYECMSWNDYLQGLCSDCSNKRCAVMGMQAELYKPYKNDTQSKKMFLATANTKPFWEFTFQITMKLFKPKEFQDKSGSISLKIEGSRGNYDVDLPTKDLYHGSTYTYLVRKTEPLGQVKNVAFSWASKSFHFIWKPSLFLDYIVVKPMNFADERQQTLETKKFCNKGLEGIKSKSTPVNLTPC